MTDSLLTRYRPESFDEVLGQDAVVASMRKAIETNAGRAFMLSGPSGCGKTTLARVAANALGIEQTNLQEIDGATHTGVEDMRPITSCMHFRPLGGDTKAVIIDECHMLSRNAWNSLLKSIEEPPQWGYWFLATTLPIKVPETIRTRCLRYDLKPVDLASLLELLGFIAEVEKINFGKDHDGILRLCATEAQGSPRQALANLGVCAASGSRAEAAELLRTAADQPEAVDLARALVRGAGWRDLRNIVSDMEDVNPESVRHVVAAYIEKMISSTESEDAFGRGCEILSAFAEPFHHSEGRRPLYVAIAKLSLGA